MPTFPLLVGDLHFFASSSALPLWYINLPLFWSTNIKQTSPVSQIGDFYSVCAIQTFQVSHIYREVPTFLLFSRITHKLTFFPHFSNLTCQGFFLQGNYSPFFLFAQYSQFHYLPQAVQAEKSTLCILFANANQKTLEVLKFVSQTNIKTRPKGGRLPSL